MSNQITTIQQRMDMFKEQVISIRPQLSAALCSPRHLEQFEQCLFTCATTNPKLLDTTPESRLAAAIQCAHLQLFPDSMVGYAYLVPFKVKGIPTCQLIIGYKGFEQLVRRSGAIDKIVARAVYPGEHLVVRYGTEDRLEHTPDMADVNRQDNTITHVYVIAYYKSGASQFHIMTRSAVEKYRMRSRMGSKNEGPWLTDWPIMALKTCFKRLVPFLPVTTTTLFAAQLDDFNDLGIPQQLENIPPGLPGLIDSALGETESLNKPSIVVDSTTPDPENATEIAPSVGAQ